MVSKSPNGSRSRTPLDPGGPMVLDQGIPLVPGMHWLSIWGPIVSREAVDLGSQLTLGGPT